MSYEQAFDRNPNWQETIFKNGNVDKQSIWSAPGPKFGLNLSEVGLVFFQKALQIIPYNIKSNIRLTNHNIIRMNKLMPWPYYMARGAGFSHILISIYSSEVSIWAALYDNDIEKLLEAYSR